MENIMSKHIKKNKEQVQEIQKLQQDYGSDLPDKKSNKDELDYYTNIYPIQQVWLASATQDELRKSTNNIYDKLSR